MSRRSDIANAVVDRFGRLFDVVTAVRWRDVAAEPFREDECPAVNVKDGNARVIHQVSEDDHELDVVVDVVFAAGSDAGAVSQVLDAVAAAIYEDGEGSWDGLASGTGIESHEIDTSADISETVVAGQLQLKVFYTTERGQL